MNESFITQLSLVNHSQCSQSHFTFICRSEAVVFTIHSLCIWMYMKLLMCIKESSQSVILRIFKWKTFVFCVCVCVIFKKSSTANIKMHVIHIHTGQSLCSLVYYKILNETEPTSTVSAFYSWCFKTNMQHVIKDKISFTTSEENLNCDRVWVMYLCHCFVALLHSYNSSSLFFFLAHLHFYSLWSRPLPELTCLGDDTFFFFFLCFFCCRRSLTNWLTESRTSLASELFVV